MFSKTYIPKEFKIVTPEIPDPQATWAEVWGQAFVNSAHSLITGKKGVPLRFGLKVMQFAEMAHKSYQKDVL